MLVLSFSYIKWNLFNSWGCLILYLEKYIELRINSKCLNQVMLAQVNEIKELQGIPLTGNPSFFISKMEKDNFFFTCGLLIRLPMGRKNYRSRN